MFGAHFKTIDKLMNGHRLAVSLAALLLVAATGCGGGSQAEAKISDPYLSNLYHQALDEGGTIVLYTHLTPPDQQQMLVDGFEKTYPGVKVKITAGVGADILERVLSEKRAGRSSVDVFQYPGLAPFRKDLNPEMTKYLANFTPREAKNYTLKGSFVPGLAYPWTSYHMGVCYNSDALSASDVELLHTFKGWTDPRWKGRATITDPTSATGAQGLFQWVYQDPSLGKPWLAELAKLDPTVYSDVNNAIERVIAGEYDVAFDNLDVMQGRWADKDAPLKCTFGEYAPSVVAGMGLMAGAPHPAAGKLFIEWLLSEQGQEVAQDATKGISVRSGMESHPVKGGVKPPSDVRVVDEGKFTKAQKDLTTTFSDLFGAATD